MKVRVTTVMDVPVFVPDNIIDACVFSHGKMLQRAVGGETLTTSWTKEEEPISIEEEIARA